MIKLYGLLMSNYYSLTKALLFEKGLEFEEVKAPPSQKDDYLRRSPMGKMPSIEVDGQFMSESLAIFTYLERRCPEPAMLPSDPFAAGKVMELVNHVKLDIELVARRCLPELLFGKPVSDETKEQVKADLAKGMKAVSRLYVCDPYAAGTEFGLADLYTFYSFGLAGMLAKQVVGVDLLADQPQIGGLMELLAKRPSIARVTAESAG
ncbi:MAG: glutathione S-transferase [Myxococcales bacterium]|nr:glutathione S-transferase [Myxococcales bacterium]HIM00367.1 glutathione S-transferase [Myxococcales bacterium]